MIKHTGTCPPSSGAPRCSGRCTGRTASSCASGRATTSAPASRPLRCSPRRCGCSPAGSTTRSAGPTRSTSSTSARGGGELLAALPDVPARWRLTGGRPRPGPPGRLRWLAEVPPLTGLLVANEWLDAVPLDVVQDGRQVLVAEDGDRAARAAAEPEQAAWAQRWWPGGGRVEVGLSRDRPGRRRWPGRARARGRRRLRAPAGHPSAHPHRVPVGPPGRPGARRELRPDRPRRPGQRGGGDRRAPARPGGRPARARDVRRTARPGDGRQACSGPRRRAPCSTRPVWAASPGSSGRSGSRVAQRRTGCSPDGPLPSREDRLVIRVLATVTPTAVAATTDHHRHSRRRRPGRQGQGPGHGRRHHRETCCTVRAHDGAPWSPATSAPRRPAAGSGASSGSRRPARARSPAAPPTGPSRAACRTSSRAECRLDFRGGRSGPTWAGRAGALPGLLDTKQWLDAVPSTSHRAAPRCCVPPTGRRGRRGR